VPLERDTEEEIRKQNTLTILIGTFLEYFDLYLYIHMGIILQEYFFGPTSIFQDKLWGAFYGWILSYIARPFGSIFFGVLGDNFGRKNIFIFTTLLMGISSFAIALLPGFSTKGYEATVMFIIFRLLQSLSSAGEFPGAFTYLSEINRGKKDEAFCVGLIQVFTDAGGLFALVVAYICLLSDIEWAWRIPFVIGSFIAIIGSFARTSLKETPMYLKSKEEQNHTFLYNLWKNLKNPNFLLVLIMLAFPLENFFIYALGAKRLENFGFSAFEIIQYNVILAFLVMCVSIVMARLSLIFNCVKLVKIKTLISLLSFPFIFYSYSVCSTPLHFISLQIILVLLMASDVPILYLYVRVFHTSCRYTAFGGSWSIGRLLNNIGGSLLHTWLYQLYGYWGNFTLFCFGNIIFYFGVNKLKKFQN
jgi:MFS family permease